MNAFHFSPAGIPGRDDKYVENPECGQEKGIRATRVLRTNRKFETAAPIPTCFFTVLATASRILLPDLI